jgi:hypothetical protein
MKKFILSGLLTLCASLITNAQQWDGLTYYSNMGAAQGFLIDTNSLVTKTWNFTGGTGYSTHMMPGGDLYRTVTNAGNILVGGGMTGRIQKVNYTGTILWDYTYSSATYCLHHDHCPLPNGNVLVISYDVRTPTDATNAGCTSAITIWAEKILELQPVGLNSAVVVWQWNVWDHLVQNVTVGGGNYQTSIVNNPQLLNINYATQKDWMHMNGIDYNPILDQIVVSSHNMNEWYVIDHSTTTAQAATHVGGNSGKGGDFLYRWGNPPAYQAAGTKILSVTHDAHWIPEGSPNAGYLVGINNQGVAGPKTTVDQVSPPRNNYNYTITAGAQYQPASFTLRHTSSGYTSNMGSSDQFPNGNQMICLATAGLIYEIDALGNTLWSKSTAGSTPQSHRYTNCFINNVAPVQPAISLSGADLVSTSGVTYQWYLNGNLIIGATTQTYTPLQNGIYVVRVTDVNGCVFAYALGYNYALITGINETVLNQNISVFPNPTTGIVKISSPQIYSQFFDVVVSDAFGKLILKTKNVNEIDLSEFGNGVYFLTITTSGTSINKKISIAK